MEAARPEWSEDELPQPEYSYKEVETELEPEIDKSQALSFAEGELATKALEKQPEVAYDMSRRAAETEKPLEGQLERKEIREKPLQPQAASIGSLLDKHPTLQESKKSEVLEETYPSTPVNPPPTIGDADQTQTPRHVLYGQAIRTGFVSAIIIILIFVLLLILF